MNRQGQLRQSMNRALSSLQEGWHQLRERASHALTRFVPGSQPAEDHQTVAQWGLTTPDWGLLAAEMHENSKAIRISIEIPGMDRDHFDIQVRNDHLIVRGEKRLEREEEMGRYHIMECAYGNFERVLPLTSPVDQSRITAKYRRGVLRIELPKRNNSAGQRITVRQG